MSLCLARTSTPAGSKGGYLEVTLDPIVNKSGAPRGLHFSCHDVMMCEAVCQLQRMVLRGALASPSTPSVLTGA